MRCHSYQNISNKALMSEAQPDRSWRQSPNSKFIRALRHLENRKIIKLPAAKISLENRNSVIRLNESVSEPVLVPDSVEKIDNIEFILIKSEGNKLRKIWNELMIVEHPQGKRKIVGRQLRYLIKSEHGWLEGASFSCAAICLEDRDKWFGWDTQTRTTYLPYVLNMRIFDFGFFSFR